VPVAPPQSGDAGQGIRAWKTVGALSVDVESVVPRLEKTASAAIAALVVAVAATVTSLASPPEPDGGHLAASSAPSTTGARRTSSAASTGGASGTLGTEVGGRRRAGAVREAATVLVVGRSPELNPRGGVATSFTCQAAARLRWTCLVREGSAPVVPATAAADVVVAVLVAEDDAARVTRLLDRLPAGLGRARLVLLGPTSPAPRNGVAARRSVELRQLAARRGAIFVDPAAAGWFSGRAGAGAFTRGGSQLSVAGRARCAERLADVLDDLVRT
jgi:hypothetical protein